MLENHPCHKCMFITEHYPSTSKTTVITPDGKISFEMSVMKCAKCGEEFDSELSLDEELRAIKGLN